MLMEMSIRHLPASPKRLDEYRSAQIADHVCSTIANVGGQRKSILTLFSDRTGVHKVN